MGKNDIISIDKVEYQKWLQNLCDEIDRQRLKAVMQLNASTLQHYWWFGNDILKKQEAQGWGAKVIDMLSTDLLKRYGNDSGYSIRNLKYMRQFAVEYPDFPFVQVPLAQLQDNQVLKSRLSKFTVTADGEFVQVPLAQITWYHHISIKPCANMTYHSYWKDEENNFDIQPYCVKLFRQRWYMVARSTYSYYYEKGPRIYSLDRIKYLHATDETFEMPKDWTAKDFFDGCFGIIAEQSVKIQPIKLKVSAGQANYIRDLKMHESQEEIERNEEYSIFSFNLRPEFDFQQELLWNGEDMEVLEPLWLRKEIAGKIKRMWNKYKEDK